MTATEHRLSDEVSNRIFDEFIVPAEFGGAPQLEPIAVVVSGQPGAGKSSAQRQIVSDLGMDATVEIDADILRTYHPAWLSLSRRDDRTAADLTHHDASRWVARSIAHAAGSRFNIVLNATFGNPDRASEVLESLRQAGYRTVVVFVAVHEAVSRISILARYSDQRVQQGFGRYVPRQVHDAAYRGVLETADRIDVDSSCGQVYVCTRNTVGIYLYENWIGRLGAWDKPATTRRVIEQERDRRWTFDERESFLRLADELSATLPADLRAEVVEIRISAEPLLPLFPKSSLFNIPDDDGSSAPPRTRLLIPAQRSGDHEDLSGDDPPTND